MKEWVLPTGIGAFLCILSAGFFQPPLAELLLLLGALVGVPLGLAAEETLHRADDSRVSRGGRRAWLRRLHPLAGALLTASFAARPGPLAGALAATWLAYAVLVAAHGTLAIIEAPRWLAGERAAQAGLIFLPVGAAWTLASRLGIGLFGFEEPVVFLTGAHFHHAGFALPILAGLACHERPDRVTKAAALGVVLGVPLVATAISCRSTVVELAAAGFLALACGLLAWSMITTAVRRGGESAALLCLASVSLVAGMGLAVAYALGRALGTPWLEIRDMVVLHATTNVLGFVLPAFVAWHLAPPCRRERSMRILLLPAGDDVQFEDWSSRSISPAVAAGPGDGEVKVDSLVEVAPEPPGPPVPGGSFERVRSAILDFAILPVQRAELVVPSQPVKAGDTLVIAYKVWPWLGVAMASRVTACFDGPEPGCPAGASHWAGFQYATLEGHPLAGEETFYVKKDLYTGSVSVGLRSWSRVQAPAARWLEPWVRRLQAQGVREILGHLARA